MGIGITRLLGVALLGGLLVAGCSESDSTDAGGGSTTEASSGTVVGGSVTTIAGDGKTVLSKYQGAEWFDGTVPEPTAADGTKEPIKVGFMNVDSGPVGAMPELHSSTDGAIEFINTELGGVDGRPIEIVPCLVSNPMSPDESQACARQLVDADVVAVLGGIGLSNGPALKVFEENGIPWVGGIPVNVDEMTSPVSFQFSGGSPGAFTAFAQDAVQEEGAKKVAVLYAEYPSIEQAAVGYGAAVAEALGADVTKVSFPVVSQDYVAPVQKAVESNPDAIFVGAADLSCAPIMQAIADLKSTATVYMVGACADVKHIDKVGADKVGRVPVQHREPHRPDGLGPGRHRDLQRGHGGLRPGDHAPLGGHRVVPQRHEPVGGAQRDRPGRHLGPDHRDAAGGQGPSQLRRPRLHLRRRADPTAAGACARRSR